VLIRLICLKHFKPVQLVVALTINSKYNLITKIPQFLIHNNSRSWLKVPHIFRRLRCSTYSQQLLTLKDEANAK